MKESLEHECENQRQKCDAQAEEIAAASKSNEALQCQSDVIAGLKLEIDSLQGAVDEYTSLVLTKDEAMAEQNSKLEESNAVIESLQLEMKAIQERDKVHESSLAMEEFEEQKKTDVATIERLNDKLQELMESVDSLQKQLQSALTMKESLEHECENQRQKCDAQAEEIAAASKSNEALQCQSDVIAGLKLEIDSLQGAVDEYTSLVLTKDEAMAEQNSKLEESNAVIESLQLEMKATQERDKVHEANHAQIKTKDGELNSQSDSVEECSVSEDAFEDDEYDELDDVLLESDVEIRHEQCGNNQDKGDRVPQNLPETGGDNNVEGQESSDNCTPPLPPPVGGTGCVTTTKKCEGRSTPQDISDPFIVLIDIGSFYSHIGLWNESEKCFDVKYSCPSVVTRPSNIATSAASLLQGASHLAGPLYNSFRDNNAIAGEDAWYCAYDHPDSGLRGALAVSRPISCRGRVVDTEGFKLLLMHCLGKLSNCNNSILTCGSTRVLVSHLITFAAPEFKFIAETLFDHFNFAEMSLMNQPILSSLGFGVPSLIVLDIGAHSTRVLPVYESFCLTQYIETTAIGGEHLTDYMELLLHGQQHEQYSSLLLRRRQQFARELKEKHAFIATSFEECVEMYGKFQFSYEKVMHHHEGGINDDKFKCDEGTKTENSKDIEVTESFSCGDGGNVSVTVDRELFYCPEVLFSPYLHEPCAEEASIADIIIASMSGMDESIQSEISRTILVTGSSSQLEGLADRLQSALSVPMAALGVENFIVVTSCSPDKPQTVNEMMWQGCANTVSAAASSNELPNLISAVDYEQCGDEVFSRLNM